MGVCRNFPGVQRRNLAYPFQVVDDAMQMDAHNTLTYTLTLTIR